MLNLQLPTDPRWVNIAEMNIEEILVDHAYCEQKAATSCISMIVQFYEFEKLVNELTPVVAEEWGHFERVMEQLQKRGFKLSKPRRDEYVIQLKDFVKKGGNRIQQVTEHLMMNALVEARSCERFKLLSKNIKDMELKTFYYELMISEAGHYVNFLELARFYGGKDAIDHRWQEWLQQEAKIIASLEVRGDRIH